MPYWSFSDTKFTLNSIYVQILYILLAKPDEREIYKTQFSTFFGEKSPNMHITQYIC
jgi:hypothetical protein